jgi:hypothetical protein
MIAEHQLQKKMGEKMEEEMGDGPSTPPPSKKSF